MLAGTPWISATPASQISAQMYQQELNFFAQLRALRVFAVKFFGLRAQPALGFFAVTCI